jgi:hypothetical protein
MTLPSIQLGSLRVSRLVVGSNAISGFSHSGSERTEAMLDYFTVENVKRFFRSCEESGISALVARADAFIARVLREYWREGGAIRWVAQMAPEHRDPLKNVSQAKRWGCSAVFVHGGIVDRHFKTGRESELLPIVEHIRSLGLPAGMAAHNPSYLLMAQEQRYPLDFCMVCMHNITGYQGQQGVETEEHFLDEDRAIALETLRKLSLPCLAYKVLAAGRKTPEAGLADVVPALRPTDGVVMGMFPPDGKDVVGDNVRLFRRMTEEARVARGA